MTHPMANLKAEVHGAIDSIFHDDPDCDCPHCWHRSCQLGLVASESGLEQMWWHFAEKMEPCGSIRPQVSLGGYRLDCLLVRGERRINVELDGRAYHEKSRDIARDRSLLRRGHVTDIVRIPYAAMWFYQYATLRILREWFPFIVVRLPGTVMTVDDVKREIKARMEQYPFPSKEKALDDMDDDVDVWIVKGDVAYAAGPKAALRGYRCQPIRWRRLDNDT